MLGFDPLVFGSLLVLAAAGESACVPTKTAEINIVPKTESIKYDTSKTLAQLQNTAMDTVNPYDFHDISQTQGYMSSRIAMQPHVKIDYKHYPELGAVCLWYDTVAVEINIDPTIVVAREVFNDSCMKSAVIDHEMKHVMADRKIVNKYAKIMGEKVLEGLQQRGFKAGPVRAEAAQEVADRMQKTVYQILEHEYKKMDLERAEAQGKIDSLEEYERVKAQCPDFNTYSD